MKEKVEANGELGFFLKNLATIMLDVPVNLMQKILKCSNQMFQK